ncbi:hypothetical protein C9I98_26195 [Photobacterium sanctipauli]|uniref:Uncharacterized protein n=1 Tax=Photobacterium sanctipauli TaxID=1342794 RepID=A0A2T3N7E1_9GAMM|nr:hypothetical protein [Photobacterium sanctipauli]PSW08899.1 hypothetical protein C9I98_26195 [Photobacterium sanctipauli]
MSFEINSFLSALIGGGATLSGVWIANWFQEKARNKQQAEYVQGVLNGLHAELESLWLKYDERMGSEIEQLKEDTPLAVYWPITQDYFTFYSANANALGHVPDKELRHSIVNVYGELKSLVDSYRMNNALVEKFDFAYARYQSEPSNVNEHALVSAQNTLTDYAKSLKSSHESCKKQIKPLLTALRRKC